MNDPLADRPWTASAPHPETGATIITNPQGCIIAIVPSADDAAFICAAREAILVEIVVQIDWKAFGRRVRAARKAKRIAQDVAAKTCGISRNYLSQIERGQARDPGYIIVLTLCRWFRLDMPIV